jgi:integrase
VPKIAKRTLTAKTVKALKCRHPGGSWYADREMRGFYAVVYASGNVHFRARYKALSGARRNMDIGPLGVLTVEEAREAARQVLAAATRGEDPAGDRQRQREVPTFAAWRETYLLRVGREKKRPDGDERYLRIVPDSWEKRPINAVTQGDVQAARKIVADDARQVHRKKLAELAKNDIIREEDPLSGHATGNRFLASVAACFAAAVKDGLIPANPAAGVKPFKEHAPRARVFSDEELTRLLTALDKEDETIRAAFALLIEVGLRLSEVLNARWEDLEEEAKVLRLKSPKSGTPQVVPLTASLAARLLQLQKTSKSLYIIAGEKPDAPRADLKGPWTRLKKKASLSGVTLHDLRRTAGLAIARLAGLHVASRVLRHRDIRVTQSIYSPLGLGELREALERRAAVLPFAEKKKGAR